MEFTNLEPIPILVFSNLVMVAFLLLLGRKSLREPYTLRPWRRYLMILTALVFCLFSFWGLDWFHYAEMYMNLVYMDGFNTSLEDVYYLIANYLSPNYLVFRAIIWGSALYLLCLMFKHVSVRGDLMLAIFCSIWLIDFGYGRVSLAYSMIYLGGSVLMKPIEGKRLLSILYGSVLLVLSLFFHKTAFFGVAMVVLAMFPRLLNKRTFILAIIMYPFVLLLVQLLLMQFLDTAVDVSARNSSSAAGQTYLNEDSNDIGPAYLIYLVLRFIPYYLIAWIGYKINAYHPEEEIPEIPENPENLENSEDPEDTPAEVPAEVRFFSRLLFYIVAVSSIFLFDLGANTFTLYVRFMLFGFIPAVGVLAWAWQNKFCPRLTRFVFLAGLAGTSYALLYSYYLAYVGVAAMGV